MTHQKHSIPLRTVAGLNAREHHQQRARRVSAEREMTAWGLVRVPRPALPVAVGLCRVAPSSGLDDDNLAGALKAVRDQIAHWLGLDDRDPRVRFFYSQRRGRPKEWAVEFAFIPMQEFAQLLEQSACTMMSIPIQIPTEKPLELPPPKPLKTLSSSSPKSPAIANSRRPRRT